MKTSSNKPAPTSKKEAYDSIHNLPMQVWLDIHSGGNLLKLVKRGKFEPQELHDAWLKIRTEHVEEFGANDILRQFIQLRSNVIYWTCEYGINDSSINQTYLTLAKRALDNFTASSDNKSFNKIYARLEKYMGRELPLETTTVFKFYNYQRLLIEEFKQKENG